MDVILLQRIEKLGLMGEIVSVKPGYARNFLLPKKKALRANKANMSYFEAQKVQLEAINLKHKEEALKIAAKMDDLKILLIRQASEAGHLYGSVSGRDLADQIKQMGFTIERSMVNLDQPIKSLGTYPVKVTLHADVAIEVMVTIARSVEDASRAEKEAKAEAAKQAKAAEEVASPEVNA